MDEEGMAEEGEASLHERMRDLANQMLDLCDEMSGNSTPDEEEL